MLEVLLLLVFHCLFHLWKIEKLDKKIDEIEKEIKKEQERWGKN